MWQSATHPSLLAVLNTSHGSYPRCRCSVYAFWMSSPYVFGGAAAVVELLLLLLLLLLWWWWWWWWW
jgi:hypothetical protein